MNRICGVYSIENLQNGKKYIGISINIKRRFIRHRSELRKGNHANSYLQRSWNKYGENNFKFEIVETCDIENLEKTEIYYIGLFGTRYPDGYNATDGGGGFSNPSEEIRAKMRERWLGDKNPNYKKDKTPKEKKVRIPVERKPMSEETKQKIRVTKTGVKQPNKKKPTGNVGESHWTKFKSYSIESRQKMSNTRTGKKFTQEHGDNISSGLTGNKHRNSSSIYIGVSYRKDKGTWSAYVPKNRYRNKISVGCFKNEIDAAKAYDEYVLKNNLTDRPLNFP